MKPFLAREHSEKIFLGLALTALILTILFLFTLLWDVVSDGLPKISGGFLSGYPSRKPSEAGILPALAGSAYLMALTAVIAVPIGLFAAVYLEEYANKSYLSRILELNIANLAGVPSIIYGLLGLQLFVRFADLGRSVAAGALTLSLLILPVIIIASREALRQVPKGFREASLALGATKWQTVWNQVIPNALPGVMTGCILALSRAIGETAPLICLGALTYVAFVPDSMFSAFTALPIQAFNWVSRPQAAFHDNAAGAILVLLVLLVMLNSFAVFIRMKFQKQYTQG